MLPRFHVQEDWNSGGDVTVYFEDPVSPELHNHVYSELARILPTLEKPERTLFHLERIIGSIFSQAAVSKRLIRKSSGRQSYWTMGQMKWQKIRL